MKINTYREENKISENREQNEDKAILPSQQIQENKGMICLEKAIHFI
jgi:hypothetical protein